ncbi:hypothetical protein K501DRAFT_255910 [Backusella circina FSU 941]|nr:hypothetical protein K501DRAFT_255910 [Backusella circina FSU 941]
MSLVAAQDAGVYFTNPVLGTVLTAGAPTSITWTVTSTNVSTIDTIELRNGNAENLALIQTISNQPYQMSFTKFDWMIPSNLTTDTSYVILARNAAGTSYSAYFTIMGLAPGVTANDFATTSAAPVATAVIASPILDSTPASSSAAVMTAAAVSSSAAASSSPSISVTLNGAIAVSNSDHLKVGMMSIAVAAIATAALLA